MAADSLVVEFKLAVRRPGPRRDKASVAPTVGKLPRVTRLLALAIKLEGMIRDGVIHDYADLARLGSITRARATQLMNLLLLAPDIQEEILLLPRTTTGRDPVSERSLRQVTALVRWDRQRRAWRELRGVTAGTELSAPTVARVPSDARLARLQAARRRCGRYTSV